MSVLNKNSWRVPTEQVVSQYIRQVTANGVVELGFLPPNSVVTAVSGAGLGAGTAAFTYDNGPTGSPTGAVAANGVFPSPVRVIATIASLPASTVGYVYVTYITFFNTQP